MNCKICGGEDTLVEMPVLFDYLQCEQCETYVKDSFPEPEELKKSLTNFLLSASTSEKKAQKRINVAHAQLEVIEKYVKVGKVYDLGAASGFFLKAAKDRGWEVYGNELSSVAIKQALERYDVDLECGFYEFLDVKKSEYDAIVMWNSLEHVFEPDTVIEKSYASLKDGGVIFIKVPAKTKQQLSSFYEREHFFEFNKNSLEILLKRKGFKIVESVLAYKDNKVPYQNTESYSAVVVARK